MSPVRNEVSLCHLVVGVTGTDRAPAFHRELLGRQVVSDEWPVE